MCINKVPGSVGGGMLTGCVCLVLCQHSVAHSVFVGRRFYVQKSLLRARQGLLPQRMSSSTSGPKDRQQLSLEVK